MKKLYVFFIFLNLFLTTNILLLFRFTNFSLINNMFIAISILFYLIFEDSLMRSNRHFSFFFLFLLAIQIIFFITTGASGFKSTMAIGALFVVGTMPIQKIKNQNLWETIFKIFLFFYISECSLAIIERIVSTNLPILRIDEDLWNGITRENVSFRSESLLGHPLQNALVVLTAMSFILTSKMSIFWKYGLWFLGFLSLLCFNTRFSIVFSLLLFVFYQLNSSMSKYSQKEQKQSFIFIVLICLAGCFLFFSAGLGERLLNMGLMDEGSASVRIDLFDVFIGIDFHTLLLPTESKIVYSLMEYRGIKVIENFWVIYLFTYGFVFLVIIIVCYFFIIRNLYKHYSKSQMIYTTMTFFVTASTNNSLVTSWHIMVYYLFFVVLFNPSMQLFIFPSYMKSDYLRIQSKLLNILLNVEKKKNI